MRFSLGKRQQTETGIEVNNFSVYSPFKKLSINPKLYELKELNNIVLIYIGRCNI